MEINKSPLKRTNFRTPADSVGSRTDSCSSTDEVVTETSESLDSNRNEMKLTKKESKKEGNTWGSLVKVMYGLESEKDMKLSPSYFNRDKLDSNLTS